MLQQVFILAVVEQDPLHAFQPALVEVLPWKHQSLSYPVGEDVLMSCSSSEFAAITQVFFYYCYVCQSSEVAEISQLVGRVA